MPAASSLAFSRLLRDLRRRLAGDLRYIQIRTMNQGGIRTLDQLEEWLASVIPPMAMANAESRRMTNAYLTSHASEMDDAFAALVRSGGTTPPAITAAQAAMAAANRFGDTETIDFILDTGQIPESQYILAREGVTRSLHLPPAIVPPGYEIGSTGRGISWFETALRPITNLGIAGAHALVRAYWREGIPLPRRARSQVMALLEPQFDKIATGQYSFLEYSLLTAGNNAITRGVQEVTQWALMNDNSIVGYRRQITSRNPCGLCIVASTQRYNVAELQPMHPNCGCVTSPIYGSKDTGQVIDPERRDDIYNRVIDRYGSDLAYDQHHADLMTRQALSNLKVPARQIPNVRVRWHDELGSILTWGDHKSRTLHDYPSKAALGRFFPTSSDLDRRYRGVQADSQLITALRRSVVDRGGAALRSHTNRVATARAIDVTMRTTRRVVNAASTAHFAGTRGNTLTRALTVVPPSENRPPEGMAWSGPTVYAFIPILRQLSGVDPDTLIGRVNRIVRSTNRAVASDSVQSLIGWLHFAIFRHFPPKDTTIPPWWGWGSQGGPPIPTSPV